MPLETGNKNSIYLKALKSKYYFENDLVTRFFEQYRNLRYFLSTLKHMLYI